MFFVAVIAFIIHKSVRYYWSSFIAFIVVIAFMVCNIFAVYLSLHYSTFFRIKQTSCEFFCLFCLSLCCLNYCIAKFRPGYDLQCQGSRKFTWNEALLKTVRNGRIILYAYRTIFKSYRKCLQQQRKQWERKASNRYIVIVYACLFITVESSVASHTEELIAMRKLLK